MQLSLFKSLRQTRYLVYLLVKKLANIPIKSFLIWKYIEYAFTFLNSFENISNFVQKSKANQIGTPGPLFKRTSLHTAGKSFNKA